MRELRILLMVSEDVTVAQCLNWDICAQGEEMEDAIASLDRLIEAYTNKAVADLFDGKVCKFPDPPPTSYLVLAEKAVELHSSRLEQDFTSVPMETEIKFLVTNDRIKLGLGE